jgi:hypothetical protein
LHKVSDVLPEMLLNLHASQLAALLTELYAVAVSFFEKTLLILEEPMERGITEAFIVRSRDQVLKLINAFLLVQGAKHLNALASYGPKVESAAKDAIARITMERASAANDKVLLEDGSFNADYIKDALGALQLENDAVMNHLASQSAIYLERISKACVFLEKQPVGSLDMDALTLIKRWIDILNKNKVDVALERVEIVACGFALLRASETHKAWWDETHDVDERVSGDAGGKLIAATKRAFSQLMDSIVKVKENGACVPAPWQECSDMIKKCLSDHCTAVVDRLLPQIKTDLDELEDMAGGAPNRQSWKDEDRLGIDLSWEELLTHCESDEGLLCTLDGSALSGPARKDRPPCGAVHGHLQGASRVPHAPCRRENREPPHKGRRHLEGVSYHDGGGQLDRGFSGRGRRQQFYNGGM